MLLFQILKLNSYINFHKSHSHKMTYQVRDCCKTKNKSFHFEGLIDKNNVHE